MPLLPLDGAVLPPVPSLRLRRDPMSWLAWVDELFRDDRPRGWHSRGVWHQIASGRRHELWHLDPARMDVLELAALLHDIGRAMDPLDTEPHAFVGARYLDSVGLEDVATLVAHHGAAKLEAADRDMLHLDDWPTVDPELLSYLDYADRTVNSVGESVSLAERRADIVHRRGELSPAVERFDAQIARMVQVERRLAQPRA